MQCSYLWRCCRCCLNCFCYLGSKRLLTLFVRLPSLGLDVPLLCTPLSTHFSAVHSVVLIVCAGNIRLLFKLLFKFRNVLNHTESRNAFACNQNMKDGILTALEVSLWFETKRNETKPLTDPTQKHPRAQRASNIRGRTGYNV